MPTYEYQCSACRYKFERFQSITAPAVRKCPHCGRNTLQRLIGTGAALIFKGEGFYQTDYRSESYKKAAQAEQKQLQSARKEKTPDKPEKSAKGASAPLSSPGD